MSLAPSTADGSAECERRIERRVGAHAGLKPPAWILAARVRERMRELGMDDAEAYAALVESAEAAGRRELDALTECLRVGETRFFRHRAHVAALRRVVIPELAARLGGGAGAAGRPGAADRRVRIWSAGCASGEEPYTLAMLLDAALPAAQGWRLEVLGTDLSEDALAVARAGVYPASALDSVPAELRERYFAREGDAVRISPQLARHVRFARRNLLDPLFPRQLDLIFCRNVLIYFDPTARAQTIERLILALAPGGYLFLGYAESLREYAPGGALEAQRTEDGVIYRRPLRYLPPTIPAGQSPLPVSSAGRSPSPVAPRFIPASTANPNPTPTPRPGSRISTPETRPPRIVSLAGVHDDSTAVAAELTAALSQSRAVVVDLDGAEYLADDVASVLRRAAATARAGGIPFTLRATRPGPRRWLVRHGLDTLSTEPA